MKRVFSLIHSSPHSQLGDIVDNTPNDIETEDAFSSLNQERSKDNLINYAKCLVKQLRYKEALVIFNEVLSKDPNDLATLRLRAIRNMTTLCVKESLDDFL
ncbi:tetratricopeptide repeat protein, partial [Bullifex sp.]|uniref:tetratricopeptide repeat protein n=1 Tax=Bullifex sp. TaxID=2815808 RepID=UPI002A80B9F2